MSRLKLKPRPVPPPAAVMIQLMWLYGNDVERIFRTLDESPHVVARVVSPVKHLKGAALEPPRQFDFTQQQRT